MEIGLFGGTFNPPHLGHTSLAEEFYEVSGVDLLVVMPSFIPPHKSAAKTPANMRYEMTKLAFLSLGEKGINYTVCNYEISKKDVSYTVNTVGYLLEKYGVDKLHLCVGSDMFLCFETWKCAKELMKKCRIYTKERELGELEHLSDYANRLRSLYGAEIKIMQGSPLPASSTYIRTCSDNAMYLTDVRVREYIKKNNLYS